MNRLKLSIALLAIGLSGNALGQDLLSKVPANSKMVVAFNGKGFLKHADVNQVSGIFQKMGLFKEIGKNNEQIQNIEDFGIDLHGKSYIHMDVNEKVTFLGGLIPLKSKSQFEAMLPKEKKIEVVNGLNSIFSSDRTLRISWDDHTIYMLGGIAVDSYFGRPEVSEELGLKAYPEYSYADDAATEITLDDEWMIDSTSTAEEAIAEAEAAAAAAMTSEEEAALEAAAAAAAAQAEIEEEEGVVIIPPAGVPPPSNSDTIGVEDEFASVDSVLARDEYQDDYYAQYAQVSHYNDSVKNVVVAQEVSQKLGTIITSNGKGFRSNALARMKDNELMRIEAVKLDSMMHYLYPKEIIGVTMGFTPSFDYGYEAMSGVVAVDGHTMKFSGHIQTDKETTKIYKDIYGRKLNPRFYNFVDENALGFISMNVSTEAYLKHSPRLISKMYGTGESKVNQMIDLYATLFDVIIDEQAIGKVFKGDNLLVLNGVTQKEVEYIDYEYDEDYNATEVTKTKKATIPDYLWAFSSDDTRVFEKLLKFAETQTAARLDDGIYHILETKEPEITPYVLMGDGMVILSNNLEKLEEIKANRFRGKSASHYTAMLKKNKFAFLLNAKRIPGMVEELDIPIHKSVDEELKAFAKYGDVYMISKGMKGNKFEFEGGVEFPKEGKNALDFMLKSLDNVAQELKK